MHQCIFTDVFPGKCTKAAQSTQKTHHRMKFEVFHCACGQSFCVKCVIANGFFMFSIDLQGLSSLLQTERERERDF